MAVAFFLFFGLEKFILGENTQDFFLGGGGGVRRGKMIKERRLQIGKKIKKRTEKNKKQRVIKVRYSALKVLKLLKLILFLSIILSCWRVLLFVFDEGRELEEFFLLLKKMGES